jgi:hypothetical protein
MKTSFYRIGCTAPALIVLAMAVSACKKNKNEGPMASGDRIRSISNNTTFTYNFTYDNQKRISRIDYDAGSSVRFTYNSSGVVMQQYNGDTPDPERKFDLTVVNDLAVKGRQYLPGNKLNEYYYQYDGARKLTAAQIDLKTGNTTTERHAYTFQYDAKNDLTEMRFSSMAGNTKKDSLLFSYTYYTDKAHISWADLGFGYFGIATICADNVGAGTYLPQLFSIEPRPRTHALASNTRKAYFWDEGTAAWKPLGLPGIQNYNVSEYGYDEKGKLIRYGSVSIEWK